MAGQQNGCLGVNTDGVDLGGRVEQSHSVAHRTAEQGAGRETQQRADTLGLLVFQHGVQLAVATQKITVHCIAVLRRSGTRHECGGGFVAAIDEVGKSDRGLIGLFAQCSQTALLPIGAKHVEVVGGQTIHYGHNCQSGHGRQAKCQPAEYQRSI